MKAILPISCLLAGLLFAGCSKPPAEIQKADAVAQTDPNSRGKQLLAAFEESEDKATWVRQNTFALTVFEKVTDSQVKADYTSKIAPFMGASK